MELIKNKVHLTLNDKNEFISYYKDEFEHKDYIKHKISKNKLEQIFNLALKKESWIEFSGKSKIFGEVDSSGISKIFLHDGTFIDSKEDIKKHEENYFKTDKENYQKDFYHQMACQIDRIQRCEREQVNYEPCKTIKKILMTEG